MDNPFREERELFNGKFSLITEENEFRMSHWVKGFGIMDSATRSYILELQSSCHLESYEEVGNLLRVHFRVYPNGAGLYTVEIEPFAQTFHYNNQTFRLEEFAHIFKA